MWIKYYLKYLNILKNIQFILELIQYYLNID